MGTRGKSARPTFAIMASAAAKVGDAPTSADVRAMAASQSQPGTVYGIHRPPRTRLGTVDTMATIPMRKYTGIPARLTPVRRRNTSARRPKVEVEPPRARVAVVADVAVTSEV